MPDFGRARSLTVDEIKVIALELLEKYNRLAVLRCVSQDERESVAKEVAGYRERIERRQAVDDAARRGHQGK